MIVSMRAEQLSKLYIHICLAFTGENNFQSTLALGLVIKDHSSDREISKKKKKKNG